MSHGLDRRRRTKRKVRVRQPQTFGDIQIALCPTKIRCLPNSLVGCLLTYRNDSNGHQKAQAALVLFFVANPRRAIGDRYRYVDLRRTVDIDPDAA